MDEVVYLAASLAGAELQRWKRSSRRPCVKAYLVAMVAAQRLEDDTIESRSYKHA